MINNQNTEKKLKDIKILYIAGSGRSGSTLLGDVLDIAQGLIHVGELRGVFDYTIVPDDIMPCSCGQPYDRCPFWNPIFVESFGEKWPDLFKSLKIEGALPRMIQLPKLAAQRKFFSASKSDSHLQQIMEDVINLLNSVIKKADATIVVDSSKSPTFAWLLSQQDNVEIVIVHLVRDPRATVYSWLNRPIPIPDLKTGYADVRTRPFNEAFSAWTKDNMGSVLLKLFGFPYIRIKYEDFVADPEVVVKSLFSFCDQHKLHVRATGDFWQEIKNNNVEYGERHLIGSNPRVKQKSGQVTLKKDVSWLRGISGTQKLVWTLLFLPWIIWFGYPIWVKE